MPRRTPRTARATATAVLSLGLLAAAGCTGPSEVRDTPTPTATATATTTATETGSDQQLLDRLREQVDPVRGDFCDLLPDEAVRRALDVPAGRSLPPVERVAPGDLVQVELDGTATAVPVDEHGCTWELRGGPAPDLEPGDRAVTVRVFAPPVTGPRALDLVRAARSSETGCRAADGLARVGLPGVALLCEPGELRLEGLVGDAWVVCGLTREDLTAQLGVRVLAPRLTDWCATALQRIDADS